MKYIPETAQDALLVHIKANYRTQTEAAHALGISASFLSAIVCGQRPMTKTLLDLVGWEWRCVPKDTPK